MKFIVCDFETEDLDAAWTTDCSIRCVGFYNKSHKTVMSAREAKEFLESIASTHKVIFHNASFDMAVIRTHFGEDLYNELQFHDTQLIAYCLDTSQKTSLNALSAKYLGQQKVEITDFRTVDIKRLAYRCLKDCKLTYELFKLLWEELDEDVLAKEHYLDIELPYVRLIIDMERNGIKLDLQKLNKLDKSLHRLMTYTERKLHRIYRVHNRTHWKGRNNYAAMLDSGEWFETTYSNLSGQKVWEHTKLELWNPNSSTQNAEVLNRLYPKARFDFRLTKDGKPTVDSKELYDLSKLHKLPLLEVLAAKSKQSKLLDFTRALSEHVMPDGRIYASMNQCVTRTGRLSSSKPNLQNIPSREKGKKFRKLFIAEDGYKLVVGDLDRIELVVLAHYLEEYGFSTYMAEAVRAGDDLHQVNADNWQCERQQAKKGIFTLIYGSGDNKFAGTMNMSLEQAREVKANINETTHLDDFRSTVVRACVRNNGVLHDILGRRLYVPEVLSRDNEKRASGERKICNYLIQGSAGSIFKLLQLRAIEDEVIRTHSRLLNVVHDEALYETKNSLADEVAEKLTAAYTDNNILTVPVRATFKAGDSWYQAKL